MGSPASSSASVRPGQPRLPPWRSSRGAKAAAAAAATPGADASITSAASVVSRGSFGSLQAGDQGPMSPAQNIEQKFEEDFSQHLQKRNRRQRMQIGAVGAGIGGAIGVAASPVLLPGLAVAALVGGAGAYFSAKRWGKQELQRQSQRVPADTAELSPESAQLGPPLRRLRYLVKWGHWQLLEYEEAPAEWRYAVLDEVFRAFSPWVQRMYLLRAKGHAGKDDPDAYEVFHHLAPLYYLLQRRAVVEAIVQSVETLAEALADGGTADAAAEERCRVGYPTVLETISVMDRLSPSTQAQLHREASAKSSIASMRGEQRTFRRHRLQRIVDAIRKVLESSEVQSALNDRRRFLRTNSGDRVGGARPPSTPRSQSRPSATSSVSSDEDRDVNQLVVPPEGVENETEGAGEGEEEYFSVSGESGEEAAGRAHGKPVPAKGQVSRPPAQGAVRCGDLQTRMAELARGDHDHTWCPSDATSFVLRGPTYLKDRRKIPSRPALLELLHVDFLLVGEGGPVWRATVHSDFYPAHHRRTQNDGRFLFVQNWVFPPFQCVMTAALDADSPWLLDRLSPPARTWHKFLEADNDGRRDLFKVVMTVDKGPWLVKQAAPRKPVLIGRKIKMTTHHEPGAYLEVVLDCCSGKAEQVATQVVCGALKKLQLAHSVLVEGRETEELPESVLVCSSMLNLDPARLFCPAPER